VTWPTLLDFAICFLSRPLRRSRPFSGWRPLGCIGKRNGVTEDRMREFRDGDSREQMGSVLSRGHDEGSRLLALFTAKGHVQIDGGGTPGGEPARCQCGSDEYSRGDG
jgi:hypothetical protein